MRPERRLTAQEKREVGQVGPQRQSPGLTALRPQETGPAGEQPEGARARSACSELSPLGRFSGYDPVTRPSFIILPRISNRIHRALDLESSVGQVSSQSSRGTGWGGGGEKGVGNLFPNNYKTTQNWKK